MRFSLKNTIFLLIILLTSCYNRGQQTPDALSLSEAEIDSISFYSTHHYTEGYNFQVRADSLPIIRQLPAEALIDMPVDTLQLYRKNVVVVGGGDTGNDCVGTCLRQGCKTLIELEMLPAAPEKPTILLALSAKASTARASAMLWVLSVRYLRRLA